MGQTKETVRISVPVTIRLDYDRSRRHLLPKYWQNFMDSFVEERAPAFPTTAYMFTREINEYLSAYNGRMIENAPEDFTILFPSEQDFTFFLLRYA